jgi:hypothetical protein
VTAAAAAPSPAASEEGKKTNGHAEWRDWPTENAVARSYGLHNAQLRRLVKKHSVDVFKAPDLTWRYSPHACEQVEKALRSGDLADMRDDDDDDADDDGTTTRGRGRGGSKRAADTELTVALRLSNEHLRETFKITHGAQRECLELLRQSNKDLIAELVSLRESQRAATQAREEALNDRLTRELMVEEQKRKVARWDTALGTLTQAIQMAVAQGVETWQDWKKPKNAKAYELLQKLASQIAEKLELTPEQRLELLKVLDPEGTESSSSSASAASGGGAAPADPAATSSSSRAPAEPPPAAAAGSTSSGEPPPVAKPLDQAERISAAPATSAPSSSSSAKPRARPAKRKDR